MYLMIQLIRQPNLKDTQGPAQLITTLNFNLNTMNITRFMGYAAITNEFPLGDE